LSLWFFYYTFGLTSTSYTISLRANLNARPRKKDITTDTNGAIDASGRSRITTIAFAPRQRIRRQESDVPTSTLGIARFLRSPSTIIEAPATASSQAADLEARLSSSGTVASAAGILSSESHPNEK